MCLVPYLCMSANSVCVFPVDQFFSSLYVLPGLWNCVGIAAVNFVYRTTTRTMSGWCHVDVSYFLTYVSLRFLATVGILTVILFTTHPPTPQTWWCHKNLENMGGGDWVWRGRSVKMPTKPNVLCKMKNKGDKWQWWLWCSFSVVGLGIFSFCFFVFFSYEGHFLFNGIFIFMFSVCKTKQKKLKGHQVLSLLGDRREKGCEGWLNEPSWCVAFVSNLP